MKGAALIPASLLVSTSLAACPQSISVWCGDAGCSDAGITDAGAHGDGGNPPGCTVPAEIGNPVKVPDPSGLLNQCQSLVFDSSRNLLALCEDVDGGGGYVVELSPSPQHQLVRTIGRGTLGIALDFALDPVNNVYVVQYDSNQPGTGRIFVFSPDGTPAGIWPDPSDAGLPEAFSIAIDSASNVYVGENVIEKYTTSGTHEATIGVSGCNPGELSWAIGLNWHAGTLWVADLARNMVESYDPATGSEVGEFGGRGCGHGYFDCNVGGNCSGSATFWGPTRIAIDAQNHVFANDPFDSRIQKFGIAGDYQTEFDFGGPQDIRPIALEPSTGNLYVARDSEVDILCPF